MTITIQRLSESNEVCVPGSLAFGIHTSNGDVVGGIGLSSGTPLQDMQCAQSGLDHFKRSLAGA